MNERRSSQAVGQAEAVPAGRLIGLPVGCVLSCGLTVVRLHLGVVSLELVATIYAPVDCWIDTVFGNHYVGIQAWVTLTGTAER